MKLALNSRLQTYHILTNNEQMLILCLSYFIATVIIYRKSLLLTILSKNINFTWQHTKGQKKSKLFFQDEVSSKKTTNKFYFTTVKPQVDLFSFIFWKKLKTPKIHFEIN